MPIPEKWRVSLTDAMPRLPGPKGERFATVLEHGTLDIEIYAPRGTDPQKPHTRDEVYVVLGGSGAVPCGDTLSIRLPDWPHRGFCLKDHASREDARPLSLLDSPRTR